jgi:large subunit ribosomal protein L23
MIRDAYTLIKRPRITEKATALGSLGKYTFEVVRDATKVEIKKAIEKIYKVKVSKVATMRCPGKRKRVGKSYGMTPDWKKAIVTLAAGQTIDLI